MQYSFRRYAIVIFIYPLGQSQIKGYPNPIAALTLQTQLDSTAFQQNLKVAWKVLRFQAPGIATKLLVAEEDSYELEYISPKNTQKADEWVATTLIEKSSCKNPQDLVSVIVNDKQERDKYVPEYGGYSSGLYFARGEIKRQYHICFFGQHSAIDGRGALLALDMLLNYFTSSSQTVEKWGEEIRRLPVSASYTMGLRKDGDTAPEGFDDVMQASRDQQTKNEVRHFASGFRFNR